jgi:hypothetical protein
MSLVSLHVIPLIELHSVPMITTALGFCLTSHWFLLLSWVCLHDTTRQQHILEANWNVMAHAQKPDFVFRRNGRVHLNQRGRQFSRLLAAEVCASTVVMLDTPCSEVVWRVLANPPFASSPSLPLSCVTACHHISVGVYLTTELCFCVT